MKIFSSIGIGLASLTLACGYAINSLWVGAFISALIGFFWLIGQRRHWVWTASLGLILFIGMAAFGIWLELPAVLMLCGAVATLAAWDLDDFSMRLQRAKRVEGERQLVRSHLWRLLMVSALGLLLGGIALGVTVTFGFWWALLLGLVAILGLGRTIGLLRRESL
jgi:hypothetical protein